MFLKSLKLFFTHMKNNFLLKIFVFINFFNISFSLAHTLPSHFADHNHESDPKYERPYIRVKNKQ